VYTPFAHLDVGDQCMRLELPLSLAGRVQGTSSFPVDRYGSVYHPGAATSPEVRVGARFSSGRAWAPFALLVEAEGDVVTGVSAPDPSVAGDGFPGAAGISSQLRKAHARLSLGPYLHLDGGVQTSHFGMGLVSNDGAHNWEPGSASFTDPRGGDRVLRAQIASGPLTPLGFLFTIGADKVIADDILLSGDSARQFFGAAVLGYGKPTTGAVSFIRRHQENSVGRATDVTVVDLTAKTSFQIPGAILGLETEWAFISGATDLGASLEHPVHDVLQIGGAARVSLDTGVLGSVVDFLYASGDQNPTDGAVNAFHVDPNYGFGLLLFQQVMTAQSARTAVVAADPQLVGTPASDLERVPLRGNATNTVAVFPKLRYRPIAGLETYGGPLFAFANVPNTDVFNTQISGGVPHGSLGGPAGRYLGTELDLGVRYRTLVYGSEITIGAEGGVLAPGNAFVNLDNKKMASVTGGRAMLRYRF
jgi:hypothetical protein